MDQIKPEDLQAIRLLLEQNLITPSQEARLLTALRHGAELAIAVSQTPMVEAIKLASIQSRARALPVNVTEEKPPQGGRSTASPQKVHIDPEHDPKLLVELKVHEPSRNLPPPDDDFDLPDEMDGEPAVPIRTAPSAFALLDQDLDLDLDESLDYPIGTPVDEKGREEPNKPPSLASRKLLSMIDQALQAKSERPGGSDSKTKIPVPVPVPKVPANRLRPHDAPGTYQASAKPMQTFDLQDDENITIIGDVNHLLADAISKERKGLVLDMNMTENNLRLFDSTGELEVERTIKEDHAERVWARIKAMGRVEQIVGENRQKGICRIESRHEKRRLLIDVEKGSKGRDVITLYFAAI